MLWFSDIFMYAMWWVGCLELMSVKREKKKKSECMEGRFTSCQAHNGLGLCI